MNKTGPKVPGSTKNPRLRSLEKESERRNGKVSCSSPVKERRGELTAAEERLETEEEERGHDAEWAEESRTNEERRDGEEFNPEETEEDQEEGGAEPNGHARGLLRNTRSPRPPLIKETLYWIEFFVCLPHF